MERKKVFLSFVYGDPVPKNREVVWERLTRISLGRSAPWFMVGDFNELIGNHEKSGGKLRHQSSFLPFKTMIENCGMLEFPCLGNILSWRGRRNDGIIRCRLDRALANEDWHEIFSHSFVEYLSMIGSDHRPICVTIENKIPKRRRQFRFDKRWIGKEGLMDSITSGWGRGVGHSERNFVERISNCRREISVWRKNMDTNEREKISVLQQKFEQVQSDDNSSQEELVEITRKLKEAYKEEELFWKQKSRNTWMRDGDHNTNFSHAQTKQRRARNRIIGLNNSSGTWVTSEKEIEELAVDYFNNLFESSSPTEFDEVLKEVPSLVTEEMNNKLTALATEEEIRKVLFMMHPGKAPGPDGMTACFFQKAWHIIKGDLVDLVNGFLQSGTFDERLNMTNICLIPKKDRPNHMSEFRPISLCNVGYKIISKVLCQRLKILLPQLISETQSAFVSNRIISDNILLAQEMFHGLRTNKSCKANFMAIKTDMSKAYDRVEWPFIENILRKMGFAERWIEWILWCVKSVKYKVLINGSPHGQISPNRGIRQGDPLSPYIFILCTEALISNLKKAEKCKKLTGLKVSRDSPPVSHLLFADDSLFFCKANKEESTVILHILKQYEEASGQQINFQKSSIQFGHTVSEIEKEEIKRTLSISNVGGMGNYLGLPESMGGSKTKIFSFVKERLQSRLNGWTSKFLSKGGKEVLIKSVASALPTYVMSCFKLPKTVTSKLTSAIARYWWSSDGSNRGIHWVAWNKICHSKSEGGLGFRTIEDFNTALLAKQLWRLIEYPDSLFAKVIKGRYYRKSDPLADIKSNQPSYGWRSITSARPLVKRGLIKRVGSGHSISVWNDPWLPTESPRPAKCKGFNYYPSFKVSDLRDPHIGTWNSSLVNAIMVPEDAKLILSIPVSATYKSDSWGWHYTKNGKYTVKSGYRVAKNIPYSNLSSRINGPDIRPLLAQV